MKLIFFLVSLLIILPSLVAAQWIPLTKVTNILVQQESSGIRVYVMFETN